jgi:hypothetical protein
MLTLLYRSGSASINMPAIKVTSIVVADTRQQGSRQASAIQLTAYRQGHLEARMLSKVSPQNLKESELA